MNSEIEIKPIGRETIEDQLVVYSSAFHSSKSLVENRHRWIKKHYENPLGDSLVFGAYIGGKLVGMNSYMPVEYNFQGRKIPMLQSCESGVITEYQGKGIWSKVVRFAVDYIFKETKYKAIIGFPNYSNSYPGFKKMGWETLFDMQNYVLSNNPKQCAKIIFPTKKYFQFFGRLIFLQRIMVSFHGLSAANYNVSECDYSDLLWDDDPNFYTVSHTPELLKWKGDFRRIKAVQLKNSFETVASCIYNISEYEGSPIIKIEKIVVKDSVKLKKAVACFLKYLYKHYPSIAFIRVWSTSDAKLTKVLKELMFVRSSHPNPFIIKQPEKVFSNVNWNLSFFDLD